MTPGLVVMSGPPVALAAAHEPLAAALAAIAGVRELGRLSTSGMTSYVRSPTVAVEGVSHTW
jgi:hypothetical protein